MPTVKQNGLANKLIVIEFLSVLSGGMQYWPIPCMTQPGYGYLSSIESLEHKLTDFCTMNRQCGQALLVFMGWKMPGLERQGN